MKSWQKILLGVVVVIVGVLIFRNFIIQGIVSVGVKQVLGTSIRMQSFSIGIFRPVVEMKGVRIYNPPGFPNEPFVDVAQIRVEYDLGAILNKNLHLRHLVLKMNEVVLVKDKNGRLNTDSLKIMQKKEDGGKSAPQQKSAEKSEAMPMQIDLVELDLGKVLVKDFTQGEPPSILVYDVGVRDKKYKDIKSAQALTALVLMEALGPAGIKSAGIYAAASVLGVAFLPAGVAGMLVGKDSGFAEFKIDFKKVFTAVEQVLAQNGKVVSRDADAGKISAKVDGANIAVNIDKKDNNTVSVKVTARKYMIPKPEVAQGILYQISQKLK